MKISRIVFPMLIVTGMCLFLFAALADPQTQSGKPAIARIWQGRVSIAKGDEYEKYLNEEGVPKMTGTLGNMGMQILRRQTPEASEFIVITYWESRDAIKKIVGEDIDRAYSLPKDSEYLLEPVKTVRHYQIAFTESQ